LFHSVPSCRFSCSFLLLVSDMLWSGWCVYSARKRVSSAQSIHFQKRSTHPSKKSKKFVPGWKAARTNYLICNDKSNILTLLRLQPPLKKSCAANSCPVTVLLKHADSLI
jgi:hypothetical protein